MNNYIHELFNAEVAEELKSDPKLALVFFSIFQPYDLDTDPLFNQEWCQRVAPEREAAVLREAKRRIAQAEKWLTSYVDHKRPAPEGLKCEHKRQDVHSYQLNRMGILEWCDCCGAIRSLGFDWTYPTEWYRVFRDVK